MIEIFDFMLLGKIVFSPSIIALRYLKSKFSFLYGTITSKNCLKLISMQMLICRDYSVLDSWVMNNCFPESGEQMFWIQNDTHILWPNLASHYQLRKLCFILAKMLLKMVGTYWTISSEAWRAPTPSQSPREPPTLETKFPLIWLQWRLASMKMSLDLREYGGDGHLIKIRSCDLNLFRKCHWDVRPIIL